MFGGGAWLPWRGDASGREERNEGIQSGLTNKKRRREIHLARLITLAILMFSTSLPYLCSRHQPHPRLDSANNSRSANKRILMAARGKVTAALSSKFSW